MEDYLTRKPTRLALKTSTETSKRCYYCPTVTLHIRGLILVGPVNHEGDQLFLPSRLRDPLHKLCKCLDYANSMELGSTLSPSDLSLYGWIHDEEASG